MPTITVRRVPAKVVQSLKAMAKRHNRSMEQEVRDLDSYRPRPLGS
jgi:plasmid stability protein